MNQPRLPTTPSLRSISFWICLCIIACAGCGPKTAQGPRGGGPPETAEVSGELHVVESVNWPVIAKVQGSLFADEVTTIAAKIPGRIVEVNCDLGDFVSKGQQLIQLDHREFELRVAQAEAQLAQARAAVGLAPDATVASLDPMKAPPVRETQAIWEEAQQQVARLDSLFKQRAIVATDLEAAQSVERVAEARFNSSLNSVREKIAMVGVQTAALELAKQELLDTRVLAPYDGRIQNRTISVGSYLQAGLPIVQVAKTNVLRYRASVPERFAQLLKTGQQVHIDLHNGLRTATVVRISPTLDPLSRSLTFEAEVPNEDNGLRSGLFAQAELVLDENATAIVIPSSSLVRFAGIDKAWRVLNGKVAEAVVQVGREVDGKLEITAGLTPGDQVILEGRSGRVGKYVASGESKELGTQEGGLVAKTVASKPGEVTDEAADARGKKSSSSSAN